MIYGSILGTIGNTPIVRINPLHSVKDRLAIAIIEGAARRSICLHTALNGEKRHIKRLITNGTNYSKSLGPQV